MKEDELGEGRRRKKRKKEGQRKEDGRKRKGIYIRIAIQKITFLYVTNYFQRDLYTQ